MRQMSLNELGEALQEERETLTPALGKLSVNQLPVAQIGGRELEVIEPQEQLQACREFFLTGNLSKIARERGILYSALLDMARQNWWTEEIKNLEREANAQLKVKLNGLLGKSLEELEGRLEQGDLVWKDKGLRRVPVSARDLATIAHVVFDKKRQLEETSTGFGTAEAKRLTDLAQALRTVQARGGILDTEITDAEIINGVA